MPYFQNLNQVKHRKKLYLSVHNNYKKQSLFDFNLLEATEMI